MKRKRGTYILLLYIHYLLWSGKLPIFATPHFPNRQHKKSAPTILALEPKLYLPTIQKSYQINTKIPLNRLHQFVKKTVCGALVMGQLGCAAISTQDNYDYWYRPYHDQFFAHEFIIKEQPAHFQSTVAIWPSSHSAILTTRPQEVHISPAGIRLVNIPGEKATAFGIFLPTALVAAYGYNPSLENAVLVMEIAPQATVNTIALKLSPPNMSLTKIRKDFGSNAIKITDIYKFRDTSFTLTFPLKHFYTTYSSPKWKLKDEGGILMILSGINVARVDPRLQKTGEKPSGRDLIFNPRYITIGEHGAYKFNEPNQEITIRSISISFPVTPPKPATFSQEDIIANKRLYEGLRQKREAEISAFKKESDHDSE
jgi:hypothetical protein